MRYRRPAAAALLLSSSSALFAATAPVAPPATAPSTLLPAAYARGAARVEHDFAAADQIAKWRLGKGDWKVVDGVLAGTEKPEDKHAAGLACPLKYRDAVIRFRFRLDTGTSATLLLRTPAGNRCRVILTAGNAVLQKDRPNSPKDTPEKTEVLARAKVPVRAGQWHTVTAAVAGGDFAAQVDDGPVLHGRHEAIDTDKTEVEFMAGGGTVSFDDLTVWDVRRE
ncbi:MAG TPA: family 16 glycoside hydrolase [Humisphaera sp.]